MSFRRDRPRTQEPSGPTVGSSADGPERMASSVGAGPDPAASDLGSTRSDPGETDRVLLELFEIESELTRRRPVAPDPPAPLVVAPDPTWAPPSRTPVRSPIADRTASSPVLDPYLDAARRRAEELARDWREAGSRLEPLSAAVEAIQLQLERSAHALSGGEQGVAAAPGARLAQWAEPIALPASPADGRYSAGVGSLEGLRAETVVPGRAEEVPPGPYCDFTLARYNRSITSLQTRRRSIAVGTVLASAAISAGLLTLTLIAPVSTPASWVSALPIVWMVPVPFFTLAFRGTLRILGQGSFLLGRPT